MSSEDGLSELAARNKRLELWLKFWRVVIVSGVVGAIGIVVPPLISQQIQEKELEITKAEKKAKIDIAKNEKEAEIRAKLLSLEQEYVSRFLERATEENLERRYRFTRYISALTQDPKLKEGWTVLFRAEEQERSATTQRIEALKGEASDEAKAEIARLQAELDATRQRRDSIRVHPSSLSNMHKNSECPDNSEALVFAIEVPPHFFFQSLFLAGILTGSPAIAAMSIAVPGALAAAELLPESYGGYDEPASARATRSLHVAKVCITDEKEPVGEIDVFDRDGNVMFQLPSRLIYNDPIVLK